jgi:hypothetical protein
MSCTGAPAFGTVAPPLLAGKAPGDLISYEEITDPSDPAFPPGARAWRVLYVSTGRDNTELTAVCGVVVAPDAGSRIVTRDVDGSATGRVVAWSHGTLGLTPRCQPSEDPANLIWGATPWGINTVAWGSEAAGNRRAGKPERGILAGMIAEGWIVSATDYYADRWGGDGLQPFLLGKIEAANTLDNIRAAHHLLRAVYDDYRAVSHDVVMWGHSQGGHAALWAGQLLPSYMRATASPGGPALALAGVAVEAPANTFITRPGLQPGTAAGFGLFDWLAHAELPLTGVPEPVPLAPFLFSYVFAAWARYAADGPADPAAMPAYPDTGPLDMAALVTPEALATVEEMARHCWADGEAIAALAAPYRTRPFLVPEVGDGDLVDALRHGRFDDASAGGASPAIAAWLEWIAWNLPGPLGTSDFDKLPMRGDRLAPVMIAAGAHDDVVHCVACEEGIPSARDCMAVALYDALKTEYCPAGEARGHLSLRVWRPEPGVAAADHSDIRGLVAAAGKDDFAFAGSPLHRFITGAFEGALAPGCVATVANPARQS